MFPFLVIRWWQVPRMFLSLLLFTIKEDRRVR